ncbi:MAG: tetratricopeptide repeat protein [bacterium]|nr:tetratricopeptide repeat protein [bacterium]
MTPELWQQVQVVVDQTLQQPESSRPAFLDEACAGNSDLRLEVESLLAEAEEASDFMERPVLVLRGEEPEQEPAPAQEPGGRRIGHYRILRHVGSGGMGTVHLAARTDDYEQPVAIKILKRGMDTDEIVRRFEHERQILANLDHPNISKLLDGGTTDDGRPYFVMERVEGERIDRYCDDHELTIRQRLELFRKVCAAVHFAHRNLVVHRDLKPGNILVNEEGEPKLLDFGIAKLLESELASTQSPTLPLLTTVGTGPMTPRYASPEQVRGGVITTASDVYSLGVLLYKLLSGHRPYRLKDRSAAELFDAICSQDPIKPSEATGLRGEPGHDGSEITLASIAEARAEDPRKLRRRLVGDLDCIVLKALRKEPEERYGSAEQLSEDIRHNLEGLPVEARKGNLVYQAAKFVRRNRVRIVMTAAALVITLLAVGWWVSQNQAEHEREIAESLAALFTDLRDLKPKAGEEEGFAQRFHLQVGQYVDNMKLAEILNNQGMAIKDEGGFRTAEILFHEALAMERRLVGDEHPEVVLTMNNLAAALAAQGRHDEAEDIYKQALELKIKVHGRRSPEAAISLNNLGVLYQNTGRLAESEPLINESLDIRREFLGSDSVQVGITLNNRAFLYQLRGDFAAAEADYRETLRILRDQYGADVPPVARALRNLATVLQAQDKNEEAEQAARQALAILQKYFKHWQIADAESVLGGTLMALERYDEAEPLLTQSYPFIETTKGGNARQTREARERLRAWEELSRTLPDRE